MLKYNTWTKQVVIIARKSKIESKKVSVYLILAMSRIEELYLTAPQRGPRRRTRTASEYLQCFIFEFEAFRVQVSSSEAHTTGIVVRSRDMFVWVGVHVSWLASFVRQRTIGRVDNVGNMYIAMQWVNECTGCKLWLHPSKSTLQ